MLPMIAQPDDEARAELERAWEAALERIRKDPETTPADRVGTYFGEICIVRAMGPDESLPGSLVRRARRAVLTAARDTKNPYARLALFSSAWAVLDQVGHDDETWDYVLNEVDQSHRPETVMRAIGSAFEHGQDAENALHWKERAWDSDSLAMIRAEVLKLCATIPAGNQSRTNCEAFLASRDGDAAL